MHKNYSKFNIIALFVILIAIFLLVFSFGDHQDVIQFKDEGLEKAVREAINKEEGDLLIKDVQNLQTLNAKNKNIHYLDGIENLSELRELDLEDNFVKSVSPLKSLTKLQDLNLRNNEITSLDEIDFEDIIYLNIRKLSLRHNVKRDETGKGTRIEDISLLGKMVSLRDLRLRDNHIDDLTPLSNLRKLKELDIRENKFDTIKPLETLTQLEILNLRENEFDSLKPLAYLTRLEYLNIHSTTGYDSLKPIGNLINLETLIIRNVEINDHTFLEKLTKLQRLNAIDTGLEDLDKGIIESLLSKNALKGDVRPYRLIETLAAPVVSQESGFYKEGFQLDVKHDQDVYYTLDGSTPTKSSNKYIDAITIEERDNNSATIVRFKAITDENKQSETISKTYFVNQAIDERFTLPIFSIITDPDNLFNPEIGIYHDNNFTNKGKDWERPIQLEFFETDGTLALKQGLGLRIHGGATRTYAQKSFRLVSGSTYDTNELIDFDFFGLGKDISYSTLLLRNSGNDWGNTMFNDALMQELVSDLESISTQDYRPAVAFINGEYFGIYNIRERYDEQYFENNYQIPEDDISVLKINKTISLGGNADVAHYENMLNFIKDNDIKDNNNLDYVSTLMDFDSFIDYFSAQIYYGVQDWPHNNIRYWRKTQDHNDKIYGHDGKWRWAMYDTDHGFGRYSHVRDDGVEFGVNHNTFEWVLSELDGRAGTREWPNFLFRNLMSNESFKERFIIRFNDLTNSNFLSSNIINTIEDLSTTIGSEITFQIERWQRPKDKTDWEYNVGSRKDFATNRKDIILTHLKNELELEDTIEIQLSNETEAGYIRLNTIEIDGSLPGNNLTDTWSGTYFQGIPIQLEAIPKEGYKFSHWEGISETQELVEITPEADIHARAIFVKE